MNALIKMFMNERKAFSVGRIAAMVACFVWIGISVYLALTGKAWGEYTTFTQASIVYMAIQLANKSVTLWGNKIEKKEGDDK